MGIWKDLEGALELANGEKDEAAIKIALSDCFSDCRFVCLMGSHIIVMHDYAVRMACCIYSNKDTS